MLSFPLILGVLFFSFSSASIIKSQNVLKNDFRSLNPSGSELVFAHVIYRHGDRTISHLYKNDPYAKSNFWPDGYGQLTQEGKRQQYKLGQYLRRRYNKLVGDKYSPDKVYVVSTDFDRTIMSAEVNLAGLFPPTRSEMWNKDLLWQPTSFHVMSKRDDYILHLARKCPKFDALYAKHIKESPEIKRIYSQNKHNFQYWSEKCGKKIKTMDDVKKLYKTLYIESVHKKILKPWAQKAIQPNGLMEYIAAYSLKLTADTPQLARLSTGFLIKDIFERFAQKINRTLQPNRSLYMYSAHETTIARVLNSLGLFKLHMPPYASSLHFELYKDDSKKHYIQIFYRKSGDETLSPMNIPNCAPKCTLEQLYKLYKEINPSGDIESECRLT